MAGGARRSYATIARVLAANYLQMQQMGFRAGTAGCGGVLGAPADSLLMQGLQAPAQPLGRICSGHARLQGRCEQTKSWIPGTRPGTGQKRNGKEAGQSTFNSSTSNISVALAGITPPAPRAP